MELFKTLGLDSNEEMHFLWFIEELVQLGYINSYEYNPEKFILNEPIEVKYKNTQRGKVVYTKNILPSYTYTCDFKIVWNDSAKNLFFYDYKEVVFKEVLKLIPASKEDELYVSYIEIKPLFDMNNMTRSVKIKIASVAERHNKLILIIKPFQFFKTLCFPDKFFKTNTGAKTRVVKGKLIKDYGISIQQYINEHFKQSN